MDLKVLSDIPPWEWPPDAGATFLDILRDEQAAGSDRLLAAELAGDFVVIDDDLAETLLSILRRESESVELRGQAAISLGPALEAADTYEFEDEGDVPISEGTFHTIQETLRKLFDDPALSNEVRRRVLESSVRAPSDWHRDAVQDAYRSGDAAWRLTAVFCMGYVRGFDRLILEALHSEDPEIQCEAIEAAGAWGLKAAWPRVAAFISNRATSKPLLLAAIEAVATIRPREAHEVLADFVDSDDEEIAEAAQEALAMADGRPREDEDEDEDED
jgi:hypothetical protein